MKTRDEQLAMEAYGAYGAVVDFKNFRGEPMPMWEALPQKIRDAWIAAAATVKAELLAAGGPG